MPENLPKIIYILGAGHCGSTLLNLMLNGHTNVAGLSEIKWVTRYLAENKIPGESEYAQSIWGKVLDEYESMTGEPRNLINLSLPRHKKPKDIKHWQNQNIQLYKSISKVCGATHLVDASKESQRMRYLLPELKNNIYAIHMIRDGRAIVNSYKRKYNSFMYGFYRWSYSSITSEYVRNKVNHKNWLRVRYEDLATSPQEELKKICEFTEIPYQETMIDYRNHPYFGILGNRMREKKDNTIQLDESWRKELPLLHRSLFSLVGGTLNHYYGY